MKKSRFTETQIVSKAKKTLRERKKTQPGARGDGSGGGAASAGPGPARQDQSARTHCALLGPCQCPSSLMCPQPSGQACTGSASAR